eukprot:5732129-Pleurochrysis_carterae.AAC.1
MSRTRIEVAWALPCFREDDGMHALVLIGLRGGSSTPAGIRAFKWSVHSAPDLIPLPIIEKGTLLRIRTLRPVVDIT